MADGKNFGSSVVRTILTPAIVTVGTKIGLDLSGVDNADLTFIISVAAGYVSYTVIRALEVFASPKWGYILGLPSAPTYVKE